MTTEDGLDSLLRLSYCARCHCSVPLEEWRVTSELTGWRHVGPLRDHRLDRHVEPNEHGETHCGWLKPVPKGGKV